ncbi:MAG: DUF4402 domain-containing protein [Elusimicrobiota bacterium]|jgi:hypothetical protein|nr:DUF4402 domain-containing protein [Elusimicrobiota bacterium]
MKRLLVVVFALALMSSYAFAQASADGEGMAQAEIIQVLKITKEADLSFGKIVQPTAGGSVSVAAVDGALNAGTLTHLDGEARGEFLVEGQKDTDVSVSVTPNVTLNGNPSGTMSATLNTSPASTLRLDASGEGDVFVGGVLTVGNSQPVGAYEADFTVTVSY